MDSNDVLLVEDEQISALDIKQMIESLNYNVVKICEKSASVLETVKENEIDLILMDIFLNDDDLDGVETTREINKRHDIPVIYLTAYSDDRTLDRARRTKPAGFLVKPITQADLQASIEMALGSKSQGASSSE